MLLLVMFVKKSPSLCPLIKVSQRCCHSVEEAEILSTSGRTRKKQGKEGREHITLVSLLRRILADLGGWVFFSPHLEHCIVSDM